jgi:two-component system, LytTR family, sensor kinase
MVSLAEEIEIVKTYLDIELVRFEGSLTYTLDIDEKLLVWKVPRFLLQPLVENAIKHGTSRIPRGHIHIHIFSDKDNELNLVVADNGAAFAEQIEFGFGLGSTVEKLSILYPDKHKIHWANEPVKAVNILLKKANEPA